MGVRTTLLRMAYIHFSKGVTGYRYVGGKQLCFNACKVINIFNIAHLVYFKKLYKLFISALLCLTSKGFMKALKAIIKPFEAPQRSVKIKIEENILYSSGIGTGRIKSGEKITE